MSIVVHRIRFLLIPGLVAIALFMGINMFDRVTSPPVSVSVSPAREIEAYSSGINSVLFNEKGQVEYTLQAESQAYYRDDVSEFIQPFIRLFRDGESRWNIAAGSGRISSSEVIDNQIESIDLLGGVEIYQIDDFDNRILLSTDHLTINPGLETMETEAMVEMTGENFSQSAHGMYASLENEVITFLRDVRGTYFVPNN